MKKLLILAVFAVLIGATLAQASFTAGPTSPVAASRPGAAVVGGKAYVMGGETAKAYSNQIHIFDFAANSWSTSAATMPTGLSNICVTSYDNKIYVVGGYTGAAGSNTLYIYDIAGDSWSSGATLATAKYGVACAAYDGYIYALGGTPDGSSSLTDNAIYDIDGNSWSTGTAIPYGFMWGAATALADGTIWIAGGYTTFGTELSTVEIYDIAGNSWSAGTSLNTGRAGLGLATDGETVYTYGGGWYDYLTTVEYYDDSKGSWVAFSDLLNTGRRTFGFDLGSGFMVAIEGYNGAYSNAFDYYAFLPTVASVNPPSGETGDAAVAVTILGTNFVDGETTVTLSGPVSKADIAGTNVVVANPGELSCDFDLTGAATGDYDVVVTTPAGEDTLAAGFEVTEEADDDDDDNDDNDTGDDDDNDDNDDNDTGGDDDDTGADDDDNDDAADDDNDSGGDDDDDDDSGCGC